MAKTVKAYVIRQFRDAGTGARFAKGDTRDIEAGAFANYAAAGLVRDHKAADQKADETKPDAG